LGVVITSNNVNLQENLASEALPRNTYDGEEIYDDTNSPSNNNLNTQNKSVNTFNVLTIHRTADVQCAATRSADDTAAANAQVNIMNTLDDAVNTVSMQRTDKLVTRQVDNVNIVPTGINDQAFVHVTQIDKGSMMMCLAPPSGVATKRKIIPMGGPSNSASKKKAIAINKTPDSIVDKALSTDIDVAHSCNAMNTVAD
jgi:hypothetical protein